MNYNKDLYQIVKIDKNASQQEINTLVLRVSPKDNPEVGKALMVLTDPQKRIEFDKSGWKDEWERDWQEERDFRHSIFKSIQNYKHHYNNTEDYTPDGHRIWVAVGIDLDPNLWTPFQDRSVGWIDKIWGIYGENWKQELENFRDKILVALDEAWEKAKKTLSSDIWESVEGGNCAECGKQAKLRWKDRERHSDKVYCSKDCAFENMKIKYEIPKYEPEKRKTPLRDKRIPNKNELKYKCSNCGKKYDGAGWGSVDSDGNRYNYCSETCCNNHNNKQPNPNNVSPIVNKLKAFLAKKNPHQEEITQTEYNRLTGKTTTKKVKWNPLRELLKWMKREGITNISLNSQGNLVIEYDSGSSTLKDNELTKEQKEIKEFFQTVGETQINRNDLEQAVNQQGQEDKKPKNDWVLPVVIGGAAVLIIILIGVVIHYRNKAKRNY
ncbi:MAG: hypothetical protein I3273_05840 [Candidatus Moeniiplasma glomeromycotorum]|nr:hypothetical protein [Candidatus Moeniiplasma glomeromycotorum]MCE8168084.1 hypothetical protein [Candidatus Moeniiplasma glomeromycotorum]MCE8169607.1 hypothetical protein [Candidatus Moeniiplasma glomeromycotorum]